MKYRNGVKPHEIVVKNGADLFLPFAVVLGIYVILFGTISPGGGFQGGVIAASAALLLYLGYGYKTASQAINMEVLRVNEAVGAIIYSLLGLCGIFLGVRFCQNVFVNVGEIGDMISAGTVTFMSYTVGYKVLTGVGFLVLLMIGLLSSDDEDEEDA